ncbi:MAG TPA: protein-L-isoaspartate(D-aspartate) O-methyltransferase [Solirubrobacteraceae bacterium]
MHDVDLLIDQLRPYVASERVLDAIAAVPRECFVPAPLRDRAYENRALAIGCGQTISQPLVVARMSELLAPGPDDRVLDIGTGSGYHAAVLAHLAAHVWSIERHARLSRRAAHNLAAAGVHNVTLVVGDGTRGLPESAPYDAINVAAAGSSEGLAELEDQLALGGRLIAPVTEPLQRLSLTRRTPAGFERELLEEVRFVPLVRDD